MAEMAPEMISIQPPADNSAKPNKNQKRKQRRKAQVVRSQQSSACASQTGEPEAKNIPKNNEQHAPDQNDQIHSAEPENSLPLLEITIDTHADSLHTKSKKKTTEKLQKQPEKESKKESKKRPVVDHSNHSNQLSGNSQISDNNLLNASQDEQLRPHKKTRRSKRGKSALVDEPSQTNNDQPAAPEPKEPRIEWAPESQNDAADADNVLAASALRSKPGFVAITKPDNDLREYFLQMERLMEEQEFESGEDLLLFIENAYQELSEKELIVSCDHEGSRIVEKLLRGSSDVLVRTFSNRIATFAPRLFVHQYGSHVLQTILRLAAGIVDREFIGAPIEQPTDAADSADQEKKQPPPSMESILLAMCNELDGCWSDLLLDPYASHVVRTLLHVLSGEPIVDDASVRSKKSATYGKNHNLNQNNSSRPGIRRRVPDAFNKTLESIVQSLVECVHSRDLSRMAMHPVASPVLQILMDIPHAAQTLIPTIVSDSKLITKLIGHDVGSHLVERIVLRAPNGIFDGIYSNHIQPQLLDLCDHRISNFVVQRALERIRTESQLADAITALEPRFEHLLFHSRAGVVVKAVSAAIRLPACQQRILSLIYRAVHVNQDDSEATDPEKLKQIASILLHLTTYEKLQILDLAPSVQGALLLQHILEFEPAHAQPCIDSMLALPTDKLYAWATHAVSSRVIEAVFAPTCPQPVKTQRRLVRAFMGRFGDLSLDKYGSHILDKSWSVSGLDLRQTIAEDLASRASAIKTSFYGKFAFRSCRIELFMKRRDEWMSIQKLDIQRRESDQVKRVPESSTHPIDGKDDNDASDGATKKKKNKRAKMDEIDELFAKKRA